MKQCPICFNELVVRDWAPCDDCGWDVPTEIEHLNQKLHTYTTYEIYQGQRLTLCNFCALDFGSYKPEFFGFRKGHRIAFEHFNFVRQVENPVVVKDRFCTECSARLRFLKFLAEVRRINQMQNLTNES